MRIGAVPLAALLALPLVAAKPPMEVEREGYRERAVWACVAELRTSSEFSSDDPESLCNCALDRFFEGRDADALPPVRPGRLRGVIASDLLACSAELHPDRTGAAIAPPVAPKPPPDEDAAAAEQDGRFDPWAWLRGLALPAWLAALPAWAWIALGFLALLLIGLLRRRDDRRHLLGPPPSMRRGGPPVAPRLPNPPPPR